MVISHVEIKTTDGRVLWGIVAKTKKDAQQLQQLQHDPLVRGCTVTIRRETHSPRSLARRTVLRAKRGQRAMRTAVASGVIGGNW